MKNFIALLRKEISNYTSSPVSIVFIIIFLFATVGCTFFLGKFYERGEASLSSFFLWHPWLYLFLIPAIGMRLWAEEKKSGTIELLFTLPINAWEAVIAKFTAAWLFFGITLLLTCPIVITVFYLGQPDLGPIISGYLGCFLLGGAYLSISCLTSSLTKNQVISFILSVLICFVLLLIGIGVFTEFITMNISATAASFFTKIGFLAHFDGLHRGLLDSRDLIYFFSIIFVMLGANITVLESRRVR